MDLTGKAFYYKNNGAFVSIATPESLCEQITNTINYYKNVASEYREEANKTHNEVMAEVRDEMRRKDEEIARMPFRFTAVENDRFNAFIHKHHEKGCSKFHKGFSISFVGTGVGNSYDVKCNNCGEEEDNTDLESW